MKLWAASMVRNEADIVEAFVRHNAWYLDGLTILDHGSTDGTYEILLRLRDEGLPLMVDRSSDPAFFQGREITAMARRCFEAVGADFVLALDADEFIRAPDRAAIEALLRQVPDGLHVVQAWHTYVPTDFPEEFGPHHLRNRLRTELNPQHKVIVSASIRDRPDEMVTEGNHWVMDVRTQKLPSHARIKALSLAHCPVRSARQLQSKVLLGYQSFLQAQSTSQGGAFHWRDLCDDIARGVPLSDRRLRQIALNYGVPREKWLPEDAIELVEDPVPLRRRSG